MYLSVENQCNSTTIYKIIIFFLFIINNIAYGTDIVINKILFNGLERVSIDTVLCNLPLKVGEVINDEHVTDSIKILFATGYFEDIVVFNDEGIITIRVKERPIIDSVKFYGNKMITEDMIKKILAIKKIESGELFNKYVIYKVEHELKNLCYNFGKFNAIVKIVVLNLPRNRVNLRIEFVEGITAKIRKINIFGNYIFSKKQLFANFQLCDRIKWWNICLHNKYQKQKFLHDLDVLRDFYLDRGYIKFCINSANIELTEDKKNIDVSLYITEGVQYSFDSVVLCGNVRHCFPNVKECISILPGELYNNNKIKIMEYNIRSMLGIYGYIQPSILIEPEIDDSNKTIKLYLYIDVGSRFYVNRIYLEGNNITKDSVIRRELNQSEQNRLNYGFVLQDQERLNRLGYFKKVSANLIYLPDDLNKVDIVYKIEERDDTGNLNVGLGIGTESGINVQFGMYQENLLGTGNSVSIKAIKNYCQNYAEILAVKNCFYVNKDNITGKLFFSDFSANKIFLSSYNLKNYGFSINYSYPLVEYNMYNLGISYVINYLDIESPQIAIFRYLDSIGIINLESIQEYCLNHINFNTNDLLLILGWSFNNLDCMYFPTSGFNINVHGKVTLPSSKNKYYKISIDSNNYLSFDQHSNWVLMESVHFGYAQGINKKENPFYDNFRAGGIETIRGFQFNSVGPKAAYYHYDDIKKNYSVCTVTDSQDTVGGNAMILSRTELVVPIILLGEQFVSTIRISTFLDIGIVWDTYWENTQATQFAGIRDYSIPDNSVRISGGISLKWVSPIGPIVFSYSKVMKKCSGDIEEPFQFSIGKIW